MALKDFTNEVLSAAVEAYLECNKGYDKTARARLHSLARKIQTEMPGEERKPAPTPEQGQRV